MHDTRIELLTADAGELADLVFHLADKHTHEIGFIPRESIRAYMTTARILCVRANDDAVGYLMPGPCKREVRIYQTIVQQDARMIENGRAMVAALIERAVTARCERIILHCADDLPANNFWAALGFADAGRRCRRKDRGRLQRRWELELPEGRRQREIAARAIHDPALTALNALLGQWDPGQAKAQTITGYRNRDGA